MYSHVDRSDQQSVASVVRLQEKAHALQKARKN